jgi:hypothetical protein
MNPRKVPRLRDVSTASVPTRRKMTEKKRRVADVGAGLWA